MKKKGIQIKDENGCEIYPNPFPVGAIYMSVDSRNPSQIFGGKWEQIKDKFLLCAGTTYKPGTSGGNANHNHTTGNCTLNVNQIPSHQHMTSNGENGAILNWSNITSGDYWGHKYKEGSFASNGAYALNQLRTSPTGGNQAHNHGNTGSTSNMPPYLAVYVWRRTA